MNRWTQLGLVIAAVGAAYPTVTAAAEQKPSSPWRLSQPALGQYAPQSDVQGASRTQGESYSMPKYAPENGRIERKQPAQAPLMQNTPQGTPYAPSFGGYAPYGVGPYGTVPGSLGTGVPAYGGYGYPGLGYPSLGYPGLGYNGLGYPGLLGGGYPGSWGGLGGPSSWMPFW